MPPDEDALKKLEQLPFEECMKRLETIVRDMEEGNVPLEEMIRQFEEGSAIAAICHKKLNSLKKKIELLQKNPEGGTMWKELDAPSAE